MNYLTYLTEQGRSYSTVGSHKAAICETLATCGNSIPKDSPILSRFMRSVFISNPPRPKYTFTWDVGVVLEYLSTLWPLEKLSLKYLTFKLAALTALSTGQKVQTLHCLKLS